MVTDEQIKKLESIFPIIRRETGWSQEEFGDRIGVTRQTINNIENKKNNLTKSLYLLTRYVLDDEIKKHPSETEMIKLLLDVVIDNPNKYTPEQKEKILKQANIMSLAIQPKYKNRKEINKEMKSLLISIGCITAAAISALTIGLWKK